MFNIKLLYPVAGLSQTRLLFFGWNLCFQNQKPFFIRVSRRNGVPALAPLLRGNHLLYPSSYKLFVEIKITWSTFLFRWYRLITIRLQGQLLLPLLLYPWQSSTCGINPLLPRYISNVKSPRTFWLGLAKPMSRFAYIYVILEKQQREPDDELKERIQQMVLSIR